MKASEPTPPFATVVIRPRKSYLAVAYELYRNGIWIALSIPVVQFLILYFGDKYQFISQVKNKSSIVRIAAYDFVATVYIVCTLAVLMVVTMVLCGLVLSADKIFSSLRKLHRNIKYNQNR